jgi:hypothetical protein
MKKQQAIKIVKKKDSKPPSRKKEAPKRKRSIESTVQSWITERRDNEETEDRSRNSQFKSWSKNDTIPAEAA